MISVLSLVVAILAVVFGPLVARANVQRQLQVAARESWMREFREQVAAFLSSFTALRGYEIRARTHPFDEKRHAELNNALLTPYHTVRLLIAEKGTQYSAFVATLARVTEAAGPIEAATRMRELCAEAEDILRGERAAIEALSRLIQINARRGPLL